MSVIMAGHAGRVPLSPARGKKKKATLDSKYQAAFTAETINTQCCCISPLKEKASSVHVLPRR